ncbi:MAG: hypothetical protein LC808_31755 [Actinobacteria bacterium]|nr:hypothetical protein [Actinomycetota bacterium]
MMVPWGVISFQLKVLMIRAAKVCRPAARSGVDVRTVAGRLGHRNASTTLNVYSHFLAEADRDAANVLGKILHDAMTGAAAEPPDDDAEPSNEAGPPEAGS